MGGEGGEGRVPDRDRGGMLFGDGGRAPSRESRGCSQREQGDGDRGWGRGGCSPWRGVGGECHAQGAAGGGPGLPDRGSASPPLRLAMFLGWGGGPCLPSGWGSVLMKGRASIWCLGRVGAAHGVVPGLASPWRGALVLQGYLLLVHRLADVAPYLICISPLERGVSPLFISLFMMHINKKGAD